jgi:hypothetical protein
MAAPKAEILSSFQMLEDAPELVFSQAAENGGVLDPWQRRGLGKTEARRFRGRFEPGHLTRQ